MTRVISVKETVERGRLHCQMALYSTVFVTRFRFTGQIRY